MFLQSRNEFFKNHYSSGLYSFTYSSQSLDVASSIRLFGVVRYVCHCNCYTDNYKLAWINLFVNNTLTIHFWSTPSACPEVILGYTHVTMNSLRNSVFFGANDPAAIFLKFCGEKNTIIIIALPRQRRISGVTRSRVIARHVCISEHSRTQKVCIHVSSSSAPPSRWSTWPVPYANDAGSS